MTKREKIILGATVAVAIGAGIFLLIDSGSKKPVRPMTPSAASVAPQAAPASPPTSAQSPTPPKRETTNMGEELVLTPRQREILTLVSRGWQRDPFFRQPNTSSSERRIETELFMYTGFLDIGGRGYAIINDLKFSVGDRLVGTEWPDYRLERITPEEAHIVSPQGTKIVVKYRDMPDAWEDIGNPEPPPPADPTPPSPGSDSELP